MTWISTHGLSLMSSSQVSKYDVVPFFTPNTACFDLTAFMITTTQTCDIHSKEDGHDK